MGDNWHFNFLGDIENLGGKLHLLENSFSTVSHFYICTCSLLLRFVNDMFDPELSATIGKHLQHQECIRMGG